MVPSRCDEHEMKSWGRPPSSSTACRVLRRSWWRETLVEKKGTTRASAVLGPRRGPLRRTRRSPRLGASESVRVGATWEGSPTTTNPRPLSPFAPSLPSANPDSFALLPAVEQAPASGRPGTPSWAFSPPSSPPRTHHHSSSSSSSSPYRRHPPPSLQTPPSPSPRHRSRRSRPTAGPPHRRLQQPGSHSARRPRPAAAGFARQQPLGPRSLRRTRASSSALRARRLPPGAATISSAASSGRRVSPSFPASRPPAGLGHERRRPSLVSLTARRSLSVLTARCGSCGLRFRCSSGDLSGLVLGLRRRENRSLAA